MANKKVETDTQSEKEKKLGVKRKAFLASAFHIVFNVGAATLSLVLLLLFPEAPWAAFLVVVASKYRVFSVKSRFWVANILSNLTDFIFCLGLVILVWQAGVNGVLWLQIALTVIYILWLIVLKPMTKPVAVKIQAGLSQFVAITALFTVSDHLALPIIVALLFITGFAVARHLLMLHDEKQHTLIAMIWGLLLAEMGFVAYHWIVVYEVILSEITVSQFAIIATALGFLAERYYDSQRRNEGSVKWVDVVWPTIFTVILILILLFLFGGLYGALGLS